MDVDFAFEMSRVDDVRGCLRLSGQTNQLGTKSSDFGEFDMVTEKPALPTVYDRFHVVHLERQPTDWYVFLEERFIGSLPIDRVGDGDAIRLVVHGGNAGDGKSPVAFFSDVQLYELGQTMESDLPKDR